MAQPIKNFIDTLIPDQHQWKIVLFRRWDSIIGRMKNKVIIDKIENDVIYLGVSHPAWAQELHLLSPLIKEKINSCFSETKINHIRFRYINPERLRETGNPQKQRIHEQNELFFSPNVQALSHQERSILAPLLDKTLESVVAAYFARCKELKGRKDHEQQ